MGIQEQISIWDKYIEEANSYLRVGKYEDAIRAYSFLIEKSIFDLDLALYLKNILNNGNPHEQIMALQVLANWASKERNIKEKVSILAEDHQKVFRMIANEAKAQKKNFSEIILQYLEVDKLKLPTFEERRKECKRKPALKIMLISPITINQPMLCHPIGIEIIAGEIKKNFGYKDRAIVSIYDMQTETRFNGENKEMYIDRTIDNLMKKIKGERLDIIGISARIGSWKCTSKILLRIFSKEFSENERPIIILGNSVSTFAYSQILKKFSGVICVLGEGELSIRGLVNHVIEKGKSREGLENIPNIAYKEDLPKNKIILTPRKIIELDEIAMPEKRTFESLILKRALKVHLETSRGCPFNCSYCSVGSFRQTRRYRHYLIEKTLAELDDLDIISNATKDNPINIHIVDDDFIGPRIERPDLIAQKIKERELKGKFLFHIETRADLVYNENENIIQRKQRENTLKSLKEIGVSKIFLGVESGSVKQLERYNKKLTPKEMLNAFDALKKIDIDMEAGFIMFDPLINIDEIKENIKFIRTGKILDISDTRPDKCMRAQDMTDYTLRLMREGLILAPSDRKDKEIYRKFCQNTKLPMPGEFEIDTVSWGYMFKDKNVRDLLNLLLPWSKRIDEIVYYLQTIRRADSVSIKDCSRNSQKLSKYLIKLRWMVLDLMEFLCDEFNSGKNIDQIKQEINPFERKRKELIDELYAKLYNEELEDTKDGQHRLQEAIKEFNEKFQEIVQ